MPSTVWQAFFNQANGKIDGAIVANDGMGDGVITAMQSEGVAGKIPFTGQDAQDSGLARILLGQQCMTVFKNIAFEADGASKLAIAIIKGTGPAVHRERAPSPTPVTKKKVAFVAETPQCDHQRRRRQGRHRDRLHHRCQRLQARRSSGLRQGRRSQAKSAPGITCTTSTRPEIVGAGGVYGAAGLPASTPTSTR